MWEAIERLQQGESPNIQDVKTNLFWEFEVIELRAERLARNANPLALVATAQANQDPYYQTSKSYKSYAPSSKPSIPTRSHTTTRYKGKEIAKPITPPSEIASEEDIDPEQAQRDKDMQKNLALIVKYFKKIYKPTNNNPELPQTQGTRMQSGIQCFNCKEFGHFAKECRKPKRVKDSAYHMEKMLLCKQAEQGVPLQAEQYDCLADTDEEIDEQELEAHYSCMAKIQEQSKIVSNTCLVETNDSNVIPDSPDMCNDDIHNDQNDVESDDELWNEQASNVFRKEREQYMKIQYLKAQLQDKNIAISELKKLIEKGKGKYVDTKFNKPSFVRQPNAQRIPKPSVLGVNHKPNVSKPLHKGNQLKDNVVPNNSQVKLKKTQVEVHPRIPSVSDKMKSVTAYLQGHDLLTGNRGSDLYTISLQESTSSTPLCLMAKASPTQAWLWHQRLSHLNFDYINLLSKKDIMIGLPKLKYVKDQLCSSYELNLCGPMRVASINRKKYILVIVDDYSRYTWTLFLRSKDETPKVLKEFLTMIQRNLQALVITVRTDRGTEFVNKTLNEFFEEEGIKHQTSTARTLEQNGVIERRNRTLVEAA
nr:hypothetical protein [Tanacetum cinerariifolium]